MSLEFLVTSSIAILAIIGSVALNPYTSFLFTKQHNRLEKNIALRASLSENERLPELDFLIKRQTRKYVEKSLKNEINPPLFIRILMSLSSFVFSASIILSVLFIFPENIRNALGIKAYFGWNSLQWFFVLLISFAILCFLFTKYNYVLLSYRYYGARFFLPKIMEDHKIKNGDHIIYKVKKHSLSELDDLTAIISHDEIYINYDGSEELWLFKIKDKFPAQGRLYFTFLNSYFVKNKFLVFDYYLVKTVSAEDLRKKKEKFFILDLKTEKKIERNDKKYIFSKIKSMFNIFLIKEYICVSFVDEFFTGEGTKNLNKDDMYWKLHNI